MHVIFIQNIFKSTLKYCYDLHRDLTNQKENESIRLQFNIDSHRDDFRSCGSIL